MTITVDQGIEIGAGVTLTSESVAPPGGTRFNPVYVGPTINLINGNTSAYDFAPGTSSVLTNANLPVGSRAMISFIMDIYGGGGANDNFVGIGNITTTLNQYLGYDSNSVGFAAYGTYFVNSIPVITDLPTWQTAGDIIDLAIDVLDNILWIRVNGGAWNNDLAADPSTEVLGISMPSGLTIPALTIYGQSNSSQFTIQSTAVYGIPDGYVFLGS